MNSRNLFIALTIFSVVTIAFLLRECKVSSNDRVYNLSLPSTAITNDAPPCLQMYDAIIKYAEMYDIPKNYAFGIAYAETRYEGPFQWKYRHSQTSCVGAIGPMQIMPATARMMWPDSTFTNESLMKDIDFNVETSMKLLRRLQDKYGDWKTVFGCYNTGRPMINDYAIKVYNYKLKFNLHD